MGVSDKQGVIAPPLHTHRWMLDSHTIDLGTVDAPMAHRGRCECGEEREFTNDPAPEPHGRDYSRARREALEDNRVREAQARWVAGYDHQMDRARASVGRMAGGL